jgi:hypothetical protein
VRGGKRNQRPGYKRFSGWLAVFALLTQIVVSGLHCPIPATPDMTYQRFTAVSGDKGAICSAHNDTASEQKPTKPPSQFPDPTEHRCPICWTLQQLAAYLPPGEVFVPHPSLESPITLRATPSFDVAPTTTHDARPRAPPSTT